MIGCPLQTFVVVVAFSNVLCSAILIASILLESTVEIFPKAFLDNGYACGAPITCKCIWDSVHKTRIADVIVFITWRYITEQAPSSYSDQMLKKSSMIYFWFQQNWSNQNCSTQNIAEDDNKNKSLQGIHLAFPNN